VNRIAVTPPEDSRRRGGAAQDPAGVGHTAEDQPHHQGGPRAESALEHPHRRGQSRDDGERGRSMPDSAPGLRDDDRHGGSHSQGHPAKSDDGQGESGNQRERDCQPRWTSEFIVGLPHSLRPEVTRLRGQSTDEHVERPKLSSSYRLHGSDQLEVLEQHVPVIAASSFERAATNTKGARPVAAADAIDQHSSGVQAGVPGQRREEVLGSDDLGVLEGVHDRCEGPLVVAHVVIRDDEPRMQGTTHPRQYPSDLAIGERQQVPIDADVLHGARPPRLEVRIDARTRAVDDDDLRVAAEARKKAEIAEQLVGRSRSELDRQYVGHPSHAASTAINMPPAESAACESGIGTESSELARWVDVARRAVERFGTPCYLNRARPIRAALQQLERGDAGVHSWLSYKTHPLPRLLEWWIAGGRGVEVVSEAEFTTARRLGCGPDQLLVNGPAKHAWLGRYPITGLRVHFDSPRELTTLLPLALSCRWRVGVRVHAPDERDARDPRFGGPFGMTASEAVEALRHLLEAGADAQSVHFHLGQGPQQPDGYLRAVEHVARICSAAAFRPRFVDFGGGLPAPAAAASAVRGLWRGIASARAHFPELEQVWLENGRFVTDQAAALAVRVLDIKDRAEGRYLICDGGRTNQALAADRGAHPLLLVPDRTGPRRLTTICGPTCMTDDTLGRLQLPEDIVPGDVLVWMNAGAYHLPWETRFSQGLCAIAWANETEELSLVREREHAAAAGAP
jgi:diaminopimelate decarboxylase